MDSSMIALVGGLGALLCVLVVPLYVREVWLREERRLARISRALLVAEDGIPTRVAWPPRQRLR